jgi:Xaa-Pro dipeptidase
MKGGEQLNQYDSDIEPVMRQESYFQYLFGVKEPDWWGILDINSGKTTLFCPRMPAYAAIIMGETQTNEGWKAHYRVEEVMHVDEMSAHLVANYDVFHVMEGVNSDSGLPYDTPTFEGMEKCEVRKDILYSVMAESRVRKSEHELQMLRFVTKASSYVTQNAIASVCYKFRAIN